MADPTRYVNHLEAQIEDVADISQPLVDYYKGHGHNMLNLNDGDDEELIDDDDIKSVWLFCYMHIQTATYDYGQAISHWDKIMGLKQKMIYFSQLLMEMHR